MDGYVLKKGGILGVWQRRWLQLKGLDLKMFIDDPTGPVKYEFVVQDVSYPVKSKPAPGRHYFTIHHASADEEPMELAVDATTRRFCAGRGTCQLKWYWNGVCLPD